MSVAEQSGRDLSAVAQLRRDAAERWLIELATCEDVAAASSVMSASEICQLTGLSSKEVDWMIHRMTTRDQVTEQRDLITRLIAESVVDPSLRPAALAQIRAMVPQVGFVVDAEGSWLLGPLAGVFEALGRGWLTEAEYEEIIRAETPSEASEGTVDGS